jgi:hypothetical protein
MRPTKMATKQIRYKSTLFLIAVNRSCDGKRNKRQWKLYVLFEICIPLEHAYLNSHLSRCIFWELLKIDVCYQSDITSRISTADQKISCSLTVSALSRTAHAGKVAPDNMRTVSLKCECHAHEQWLCGATKPLYRAASLSVYQTTASILR